MEWDRKEGWNGINREGKGIAKVVVCGGRRSRGLAMSILQPYHESICKKMSTKDQRLHNDHLNKIH